MSGFGFFFAHKQDLIYRSSGHSCLAISSHRKNPIFCEAKYHVSPTRVSAMVNFKVMRESGLREVHKLKAMKFHFFK